MKRLMVIMMTVALVMVLGACGKSKAETSKYMVDSDILRLEYVGREDVTTEGFLEAQEVIINATNKSDEDLVLRALNLVIDGVEFDSHKLDYHVTVEAGATNEETVMQILKMHDKYKFNKTITFDLAVFKASDQYNIEDAYGITIFLEK